MKLSIITINYNNLEGLKKTYESVVCQTWTDYEWIIIDGGSTDGSKEFIEEHADKFSYWCSEPDKGVYNAMNKGIVKARGEYLNFMNSGDCYFSNTTLETVLKSQTDADIIYGNCNFVDANRTYFVCYPKKLSLGYLFKETICHQASYIKTALLKESGYREDLKLVSDWERFLYWFHNEYRFAYIDKALANYEVSGISSNSELLKKEKQAVITDFVISNPLLCAEELSVLQDHIDSFDCYEVNEAARLVKRGHFRRLILRSILKLVKFFD